ncbi:MAG: type IV pilus secretin PilQ [Deltaproteobacteria bacterium]|nr:type IV pilus secretin PilQ [Deltaproteobacteria bacterium]
MNSLRPKTLLLLSFAMLALFFPVQGSSAEDSINHLIQNLKSAPADATRVQPSLMTKPVDAGTIYKNLARPVEARKYTGKKISLDLQDADVVNVLRLIADIGGVNIVFGSDVSGKVTVNLKNIPWDQALDIVLMTNGLDKVRMGKIIRIARSETITEEANKRLAAMKASDKVEPLVTRIIPVNYSDIKTIKDSDLVKNILSDRGKIDMDERTNTLIVYDIAKNVDKIEALVERLDTRIPQVLIEARIVEVTNDFSKELGIQWGFARAHSGTHTTTNLFGGNTGSDAFYGLSDPSTGTAAISGGETLPVGFNVNLPAGGEGGSFGFNVGRFFSNSLYVLDARLSLAQSKNEAKVISSPRIMTIDNQKADVVQGEDIPYSTVSQNGTQIQFVKANLELIVTPHVTAENTLLLDVETHRDSAGTVGSSGAPPITRNTASTTVLLNDGETTVIGGIYIIDKTKSRVGVPWLMDVPYLGKFFRRDKVTNSKKELLVFLTPKIIR